MSDAELPTLEAEDRETPVPRGPWSFLREALPGGFRPWGVQLLLGWLCFQVLTSTLWALHLRAAAGQSALPAYWGELITLRDLWEMAENGGMKSAWNGPWVPLAALASAAWFLWAGWKVQARAADVRARLRPWLLGLVDGLVLALLPVWFLASCALWAFSGLASTGIQGLGWLDWVGGLLVRLSAVSTFFLQVWLCRLGRSREGARSSLLLHWRRSLVQLWKHPIQWFVLVVAGVALRAGLAFLALAIGWRMGGGTALRVWAFLGWQALAVLLDAWLIGWFLRVTSLFWRNEVAVETEIQALKAGRMRAPTADLSIPQEP